MKKIEKNCEIKKAARNEVSNIEKCPRYVMRAANRLAKSNEAKECDGVSVAALREQYRRICEVFGSGGYWWDSLMTDGRGGLVTAMRVLKVNEVVDSNCVITYCGTSYVVRRGRWTLANVITSAAIRLQQAEQLASAFGARYSWQPAPAAKKAKKMTKKAANVIPSKTAKALKDINQRLRDGKITKAAAAAAIEALIAA